MHHSEEKGWAQHGLVSYSVDVDGCGISRRRFTPEQGASIQKALEKAMGEQFAEREDEHPDVAAATPS